MHNLFFSLLQTLTVSVSVRNTKEVVCGSLAPP